ncbi:uncharacterized protein LOC135483289 [Lineus longissimus]|uniref:uncharacterized protein LOC135483289 n=1 Tax=Lineus longissimus TaxID=88925 RepID=UPI002B4D3DBD
MWRSLYILCLAMLVSKVASQILSMSTCDNTKSSVIIERNADAFIAGLFSLRNRGQNGQGCGTPDSVILPSFEAARFAINKINSQNYIPGVKLGMKVFDTCGRPEIAAKEIMQVYPNYYSNSRFCQNTSGKMFLGIIGASKSGVSTSVADWLGKLKGAQVSPSSTSTDLGDISKYPSFMRTIPSDSLQATAILEVLKKLKWKFINLVYSNDVYGKDGYSELLRLALDNGICVTQAIPVDPANTDPTVVKSTLERLAGSSATAVVYFGSPIIPKALLDQASSVGGTGKLQWLFSGTIGGNQYFAKSSQNTRGYLSIAPGSRESSEFKTYWLSLDEKNNAGNPWHADWYMSVNNCKLPGVTYAPYGTLANCPTISPSQKSDEYVQNQYALSTIDAVYTFAAALKKARSDKGCGSSTPACPAVSAMTTDDFFNNYLKKVDITFGSAEGLPSLTTNALPTNTAHKISFDGAGERMNSYLEVWNYNDIGGKWLPKKVGYYYKQKLDLFTGKIKMYDAIRTTALPTLPDSLCPPAGCGICLTFQSPTTYLRILGDIYINAVFSVHNNVNGITCSRVRADGAQLSQAFIYAIKNVKTKFPNILKNIRLGALGFDDCSSNALASSMVSNYHSGIITVIGADGKEIKPLNTVAYTAAHDSTISITVAEVLNKIRMPQVGYRSTSTTLSDRSKFPYFMRTVPKDNKQARAIVLALKQMGWDYVQAVQAPDDYGREGVREFISQAASEGLCVTAKFEIGTQGSYEEIVNKLLAKKEAMVVVVFGEIEDFRGLLQAIKTLKKEGQLLLFGSETWGNSLQVTRGLEDTAVGSFSVKLSSPFLTKYENYLKALQVSTYVENPWFREFYQEAHNCYLSAAHQPFYHKPCSTNQPITDGVYFEQDEYAYYIINAVYAISNGLDRTLAHFCGGTGYSGVCNKFINAPTRGEVLLAEIEKAAFSDEANKPFRFLDREGEGIYEIYNYKNNKQYDKLGEFKFATNRLDINSAQAEFYNNLAVVSKCAGGTTCRTCLQKLTSKVMHLDGQILIGALFPIHYTGGNIYTCGDIKPYNGFQYSEAFAWAIDEVNKGAAGSAPVRLDGVKLGGVGLDDCSSEMQASNLVSTVHSQTLQLSKNGQTINPTRIHAWLSYGSLTSMKVGEMLRQLQLPLVSPSATSTVLKDKVEYSTFYRTVPPDDKQMTGMAALISKLRVSCIQTVHSGNIYGRTAFSQFRRAAKDKKLCIPACFEMDADGGNANAIMVELAKSTTRVVLVIAEPEHVAKLLAAKKNVSAAGNIQFIGSENWGTLKAVVRGYENQAANAVTMKVQAPVIPEFTNYMSTKYATKNSRNPWFDEAFQQFYQCDIGSATKYGKPCINEGTTSFTMSPNFEQENWVVSTIDAVFAITQAIKITLTEVCGSYFTSGKGVCAQFAGDDINVKILDNLAKVNFLWKPQNHTFMFNERAGSMGYDVFKYQQKYTKIGRSDGAQAEILPEHDATIKYYQNLPTGCSPCDACKIGSVPDKKEKFTLIEGDVMIGGVFDVHLRDTFPFACAGVKNGVGGFQLIEAFNFAIEQVNSKRGWWGNILQGVKLGGVGLDACESAIRAGNLIADFHSGVITLEKNGQKVDPKKIVAYVGASSTDRSMQMADVLTVLGIPQISYGSSGMQLKDRKKYPFFTRTIPSDEKQMKGIVTLLKKFDIDNIQVINSPDPYGISASTELIRIAKKNDICIAQNITFQDRGVITPQSAQDLVNLLLNRPNATVVVTILPNDYISLFLKAVKATGIQGAVGKFRFIASEGWGNDPTVIKGAESFLDGTVTFNLESAPVKDFDKYLKTKFPNSYTRNPWFSEYYEKVFQCTLPGNILQYPKPCPKTTESVTTTAAKYKQDPLVMYVVNAVYSAAIGINHAIKDLCGTNHTGLCDKWRASQNKKMVVLQGIKQNTSFTDATNQLFKFVGDGESIRGYDVYSLDKLAIQGNILAYKRIGKYVDDYNQTSVLNLQSNYQFKWNSNCSFEESCNMCPYKARKKSIYMQVPSTKDINMVGFFNIHEPGPSYLNCGKLDINGGFQQMLAFFYALEKINAGKVGSADVKIGGLAIDTCANVNRMRIDLYSYLSGNGICYYAKYTDLIKPETVVNYMTQGDTYSTAASQILGPKKITSISPMADSPALSDNNTHPFFLRTIPPCTIEAKAIADILIKFKWDYFLAVYSDDACGKANIAAILSSVASSNGTLCMGKSLMVPKDATAAEAASIITTMAYQYKYGRALVMFTSESDTTLILNAAHGYSLINRFIFIAGRGWSNKLSVHKNVERVARGAITLSIRNYGVSDFRTWTLGLNMTNQYKIPIDWFHQFWQDTHQCYITGSLVRAHQYKVPCSNTDVLTQSMIQDNPDVLQTIIATYITARGMSDLYRSPNCTVGACTNIKLEDVRRTQIYSAIKSANLDVLPDDIKEDFKFLFRLGGYGNTGYFVHNLQKFGSDYKFVKLGKWSGSLNINTTNYKTYQATGLPYPPNAIPTSSCPSSDPSCGCEKVIPQPENSTLIPPPVKEEPFKAPLGIALACLNIIGAFMCFILFFHFICFYPKKGGTQSLGFFCLFSLMLMFIFNFSYLVHACAITCGVRRFCQGVIYAMIFAPMCVKVMNTWRITGLMKDDFVVNSRRRFSHPAGLMMIAICLILVQVIIGTEWLIIEPPTIEYINFNGQEWPRCAPEWFYNQGLVLSCLYVVFLMCLTTFFAGICWPVKENNHEARWIMGGSAFVMGSWLVWCIVSTMTDMQYRDGATAIGNLFSGFGLLGFVFFRKCHLLNQYRKAQKEKKTKLADGLDYPDKDSEKHSVHSTKDSKSAMS